MQAADDRQEFAPPPARGRARALVLALLAHALLLAALTWGVRWKQSTTLSAEAELWSAVPQAAAPPAPPQASPQAPVPALPVPAVPVPVPVAPPAPTPAPPKAAEPDIALEREKARIKKEKQQAALKLEQKKHELEKQRELEKQAALEKQQALVKQKAAEEAKRQAAVKKQEEAQARREATELEAQRQANLKRVQAMAGSAPAASAAATATPPRPAAPASAVGNASGSSGTAAQSSGPSASYAGRVSARVKPNIVFTDDISSNAGAEVEVSAAPDGRITGSKLTKSSGSKAWDDAVLKAIAKTEMLPRDVDGRVPPLLLITFRPRE